MNKLNLVMTAMALMTVGVGVYISRFNTQQIALPPIAQAPDVLSEATFFPSPTELPNSPTPSPIIPTPVVQSPIPTQTPQPTVDTSEITIGIFIYPGATVNSQVANQLNLSSSADPNEIITWYKNRLLSLSMPAKSVASTNTNGNYLTRMAGAKNNIKVNIEISKPADQSITSIKVELSN